MKPLFTTEEELKQFLPLSASFKLAAVAPFLSRVQQKQIRDALGTAQLNELANAYTAATADAPLTESLANLLQEVRVPLAALAFALYTPGSTVLLTAGGAKQSGTDTMKPPSPAAIALSVESLTEAGNAGLESLLEFLEENRATFTTWASSEACTVLHAELLSTAKEFNQFVYIDESRRRFQQLQPSVRDAQRLAIRPVLGREMLEELRTQRQGANLTAANKLLLSYVLPALANLAICDDPHRQATGAAYLEELREFLYEHADDYPTFKASSAYKPDLSTQLQQNAEWGFHGAL